MAHGVVRVSTRAEQERWLLAKGWRRRLCRSAWCWYQPRYPAAHYRLRDALALANARRSARARA